MLHARNTDDHGEGFTEAAAKLSLQAEQLAQKATQLKRNILQRRKASLTQTAVHVNDRMSEASESSRSNITHTGIILPDLKALVNGQSLLKDDAKALARGPTFLEQPKDDEIVTTPLLTSHLHNSTDRFLAQDFFNEEALMTQDEK